MCGYAHGMQFSHVVDVVFVGVGAVGAQADGDGLKLGGETGHHGGRQVDAASDGILDRGDLVGVFVSDRRCRPRADIATDLVGGEFDVGRKL
jgi:hypothetical protein